MSDLEPIPCPFCGASEIESCRDADTGRTLEGLHVSRFGRGPRPVA